MSSCLVAYICVSFVIMEFPVHTHLYFASHTCILWLHIMFISAVDNINVLLLFLFIELLTGVICPCKLYQVYKKIVTG